MNNLDVSLMNVLKSQYPDIFESYFNSVGATPNVNLATRQAACKIFKKYSTEDFCQFMQRYKSHIAEPKRDTEKIVNKLTQTVSEEQREYIVCNEGESSSITVDPLTCEASTSQASASREQNYSDNFIFLNTKIKSPSFRNTRIKENFDALKFLKDKQKNKELTCLDFQSDKIEEEFLIINGCVDVKRNNRLAKEALKKMSEYLGILNKTGSYRILDVHVENL